MALHNLARVYSSTTGTGTLTLGAAVPGFLTFGDAGVLDGETVTYSIRDRSNSEIGQGVYTASGTTLSRVTVYESTNSGNKISCSGNEQVLITAAAENIGWNLAMSESGASVTNWTVDRGTWVSDGTVIKQTDKDAAFKDAYFNTQQPVAPAYVLEADVKMVSAGAGAVRTVGLVVGYGGAISSAGVGVDIRLSTTRKLLLMKAFTTEILTVAFSFSDDTFYRLRVVTSGGVASAYVDGVLIGSAGQFIDNAADARYIGLQSFGCEAHWKNIKGYSLALPF